jgi:L-fuconolactonase
MTASSASPLAGQRVDAHVHIWRYDPGEYFWIDPGQVIGRDYTLADLHPLLADVTAIILVQAAPSEAETDRLLRAGAADGLVRGVVGWIDLAAPNAPDRIAAMAATPLLKGLRPMLGFIEETGWILRPDVRRALSAMGRHGLRLDVPARVRHLPLLPELAQRHPDLAMVIDHGAKPAITRGGFQPWADDIARVARETRMSCKLSGLVNEARPGWRPDDLRRYVDHLLACFGPERLMWGSDWPVVDLAGGLPRWREAARGLLPDEALDATLGGTAAAFYGL